MMVRYAPLLYVLVYVAVGFFVVAYVVPFLLPFVLAIALAAIIEPAVKRISRNGKVSRGVAVLTVLFLVLGGVLTAVGFGFARLVAELVKLSSSLPDYYGRAVVMFDELMRTVDELTSTLPLPVRSILDQQVSKLYLALEKILAAVLDALRGLPGMIGILAITLIATFFISRDRESLARVMGSVLPDLYGGKMREAQREVIESTIGLVKAELILVLNTTVFVIVALWLMGSEFALVLGLLVGALDILPVLGPGIVFVPWAVYCFLFGSVSRGLFLIGLYAGVSAVRQALEAKIVGDKTGLHPLATLFSMYLGVKLFGAPGLLLGPIMAIILKAVIKAGVIPAWPGSNNSGPPAR